MLKPTMTMRLGTLVAAIALTASMTARPTAAQALAYGAQPVTLELGPGITAVRYTRTCGYQYLANACFGWSVHGLLVPGPVLGAANAFAAARGSRIVVGTTSGVLYTDDRGVHWFNARWDGARGPLSIAFDATSDFGAAVGENGSLWTSEDRGQSWHSRRDSSGQRLIDVAVIGHTIAFADSNGGAWVSTDGGTSVRTLAERAGDVMPTITVHDRAIWVLIGGSVWWRADANGNVERMESGSTLMH